LWVADIPKNRAASPGKPRLLFDRGDLGRTFAIRCYDLSLDGQRFLMVRGPGIKPKTVREFALIQNWFEELKRVAPAKK
jgi:hypothetical protein